MYLIWIGFMAIVIGALALPFARRMGYSYGRFGRSYDILLVLVVTLILSAIFIAILSAVGLWEEGTIGALILGAVGAFIAVILLALFSTQETIEESEDQNEFRGEHGE